MRIWTQKSASIQPRTSRLKYADLVVSTTTQSPPCNCAEMKTKHVESCVGRASRRASCFRAPHPPALLAGFSKVIAHADGKTCQRLAKNKPVRELRGHRRRRDGVRGHPGPPPETAGPDRPVFDRARFAVGRLRPARRVLQIPT